MDDIIESSEYKGLHWLSVIFQTHFPWDYLDLTITSFNAHRGGGSGGGGGAWFWLLSI